MCYLAPTAAAIATTIIWQKNKSPGLLMLMLMFYGGSIFGLVDHLLNGELFLVSHDWTRDALLGVVITLSIVFFWVILITFVKWHFSPACKFPRD